MSRYLVVDDSPTVRLALSRMLQTARPGSPEIVQAANGQDAMARFGDGDYTAVFLDMVLAGKAQGLEVMQKMLAAKPNTKVILVTGLVRTHADVEAAIMQGAFSYLRKPIHVDDVRRNMDQIEQDEGRMRRIR